MTSMATRVARAVSDFTIGTVIVLIHVARADRYARAREALPDPLTRRSRELPPPATRALD